MATTRERAQDETHRRLTSLLTLAQRAILGEIAWLTYLRALGADAWEGSSPRSRPTACSFAATFPGSAAL